MTKTVGNDFQQAVTVRPGYEDFFAGIMDIAGSGQPDDRMGEALRRHVQDFLAECDLGAFRKNPEEPYTRIYLGRDAATGWEAILMCWAEGSVTTVHGHPGFAAYNFASGRFCVELFALENSCPQVSGTFSAAAGNGYFAVGRPDTYDNHIHRITCLSETGHSLHIYCGDARKGIVYDPVG